MKKKRETIVIGFEAWQYAHWKKTKIFPTLVPKKCFKKFTWLRLPVQNLTAFKNSNKYGVKYLPSLYFKRKKQLMLKFPLLPDWFKNKITTYDKLFSYYAVNHAMSTYTHKAFVLIEMQLNANLVRMQLVPYLFLVTELCFYRIVSVNAKLISSPYYILSLYDNVKLPIDLFNTMYYRSYRVHYYPTLLTRFFKNYWMQFLNYNQNKTWLLTNFLVSTITAEGLIFDYPNILLYMSPFRRFSKIYQRHQPYTVIDDKNQATLAYTHVIIKLKLFSYASFY